MGKKKGSNENKNSLFIPSSGQVIALIVTAAVLALYLLITRII